ncbi:MAG TPA: glycosyl hydrolase 53 family protein [Opitutaceae bacterium]
MSRLTGVRPCVSYCAVQRMPIPALAFLLCAALLAGGCADRSISAARPARQPFKLGADISALDAPSHRWPLPAYRENGRPSDELAILRGHGWSAFRVRVFVDQVREAPNNTLAAAIPLAQRIKASGATFLLCIHLSDTWADPQHQDIPVAWRSLNFEQLESRVESYCFDTVKAFRDAGAMPDWVQVGNEITRGTLWPVAQVNVPGSTKYNLPEPYDAAAQWDRLTGILKSGIRGVMAASGNSPPRIAIHIDRGADWAATKWFFEHLGAAHVPYDIIAESFYPEWAHGTLSEVQDNMSRCAAEFGKDFLVVETGYGSSHVANNPDMLWPQTPEGRLQYMADLINTVKRAPHGIGVLYWQPEWQAWNRDGSPGPVVSVLGRLDELSKSPGSHEPPPPGRNE